MVEVAGDPIGGCIGDGGLSLLFPLPINNEDPILGIKITIQTGELQKGSTPRRCPDISKLKLIGYQPKVNLKDGLQKTITWYVKALNEKLCHN